MVALILELKKEYIYIGMIVSGLNEQGEHIVLITVLKRPLII